RVDKKSEEEPFCMTVLALKGSRAANGVSELHGQVSRQMWKDLYPGVPVDQVPIGHITNGIHLLGWMKGPVRRFWRRKLGSLKTVGGPSSSETTRFWNVTGGSDWENEIHDPQFWNQMDDRHFVSD